MPFLASEDERQATCGPSVSGVKLDFTTLERGGTRTSPRLGEGLPDPLSPAGQGQVDEGGHAGVEHLVRVPGPGRLAGGHRRGGAFPRYARNTGTGEPLATAARLVSTDIEVYHDQARPSALVLPG
jgi:hypothetical protein